MSEGRVPTGAEIAALMQYCPTFHADDAECCGGYDRKNLCDYHAGWADAWLQANDQEGVLPATEIDRLMREGLLR